LIRARFPQIPRSGLRLQPDELLPETRIQRRGAPLSEQKAPVAIVLEAKLKLIHSPQNRALVGLGYRDAFFAADHVPEILQFHPIGLEGFEGSIVDGLQRKGAPNLNSFLRVAGYCWWNLDLMIQTKRAILPATH